MSITNPTALNSLTLDLDLQVASEPSPLPQQNQVEQWILLVLETTQYQPTENLPVELTLRIVDAPESQQLNRQYRGKDKPTNVLSFPFEGPEGIPLALLGDLVVCAPVVRSEAEQQHKSEQAHWAHMVVHGTLHLLGYDHIEEQDADIMEALEIRILDQLGFQDPYAVE